MNFNRKDTIVALSTAHGSAAIAVLRLSGPKSISMVSDFFYDRSLRKKDLLALRKNSTSFGLIVRDEIIMDEVLVTVFKGPHSFTGEDTAEIACHGSLYIQQQLLQLFLSHGARMAEPGEFTMRAFLNGKMDLSQAEAVADLIASNSPLSHQVAMQQMRGGFSKKIIQLREQLINFASLIELELDFSEEDVEFANRTDLQKLIHSINATISQLLKSFELGNVLKNGVPVAIIGLPNAGKSTLLNALLEDERAIVSDIPGTTRDTIEDEITVEGILFRFIDTAGLRATSDLVEQIGVKRALETMKRSSIVIYLFDAHELGRAGLAKEIAALRRESDSAHILPVANKIDREDLPQLREEFKDVEDLIFISAKEHVNIDVLRSELVKMVDHLTLNAGETIVTNARHASALRNAAGALDKVSNGLNNSVPGDLLALDIRFALQELGNITGQVSGEDLLTNIFTKFCIGK